MISVPAGIIRSSSLPRADIIAPIDLDDAVLIKIIPLFSILPQILFRIMQIRDRDPDNTEHHSQGDLSSVERKTGYYVSSVAVSEWRYVFEELR